MAYMKLKFKRTVTVDFNNRGEWNERTFAKGDVIDLTDGDVITHRQFADIAFGDGAFAESVPVDSFEEIT